MIEIPVVLVFVTLVNVMIWLMLKDKMEGAKTTSKTYKSTVKMDDYNVDRGRSVLIRS